MASGTRVLLAHGIEGSPDGYKASLLRNHFEFFECVRMPTISTLRRAKYITLGVVALVFSAIAMTFWWGYVSRILAFVLLCTTGVAVVFFRRLAKRLVVPRLLETCVQMQAEAISKFQPDLLVGSSWGGAVVLELVSRGLWKGPVILLAPAHRLVSSAAGEDMPHIEYSKETGLEQCSEAKDKIKAYGVEIPETAPTRLQKDETLQYLVPEEHSVLIVQGVNDTKVPKEHSLDLAAKNKCTLVVDAQETAWRGKYTRHSHRTLFLVHDDHSLATTCTAHLIDMVEEMAGRK